MSKSSKPPEHDFAALDAAILRAVASGQNTFTEIVADPQVHAAHSQAATALRRHRVLTWRLVDERLQVMRSQRVVALQGFFWKVID